MKAVMHMDRQKEYRWLRKYAPTEALSNSVDYYWIASGYMPEKGYISIAPNCGAGLIFNLGEPIIANGTEHGKSIFMDGANSKSANLTFSGRINTIGVRFRLGEFCRFVSTDLSKHHNTFSSFSSLGYEFPQHFFEYISQSNTDREKITSIETWLLCLYTAPDSNMRALHSLIDKIIVNSGRNIEIESHINPIGLDLRKLQRIFKKQIGMSPKKVKKLIRASCAKNLLIKNANEPFSNIGQTCGYYDQAHFNREFKDLFGITPSMYRKKIITPQEHDNRIELATIPALTELIQY